jgi:hypothetical protein
MLRYTLITRLHSAAKIARAFLERVENAKRIEITNNLR